MLTKVKVFLKAKEEKIVEKAKDSFEISVKEKPEKGMANKAVVRILASYLNIEKSGIRIVKGGKQRNKIFKVLK